MFRKRVQVVRLRFTRRWRADTNFSFSPSPFFSRNSMFFPETFLMAEYLQKKIMNGVHIENKCNDVIYRRIFGVKVFVKSGIMKGVLD